MEKSITMKKDCVFGKEREPNEGHDVKYFLKRGVALVDYKEILNGTEYGFIKENEHLGKHVILLGLAGSYSYGTNIDGSDIDVRGITLNQKSDLIGLTQFEQHVEYYGQCCQRL